ncbi:MAG: AIDA repeat-containing protein [Sporomusaceae bacterium]|nr:AIDA repeat-containing protein [Sporomusaceae bacterium]
MGRKHKERPLKQQEALSVALAVINGVQVNAPMLAPLAVVVPEKEPYIMATLVERGGEVADSLFFSTVHAAYTADVSGSGTIVSGEAVSGQQWAHDGGSTTSTTINSGGFQFVYDGGIATSTTINSDGFQYVRNSGSATSTTINSGGWQFVYSGGRATSTTINSGSTQTVYNRGSATSTTIYYGSTQFVDDGTAVGLPGGSGGTASDTTLLGGMQLVSKGGQVSGTVIGGTYTSSGFIVSVGGYQSVGKGGSATSTTINSGGTQTVYNRGSATSTTIYYGGTQFVDDGTAVGFPGGSGGTASDTTLLSGGVQLVSNGGQASGTVISGAYHISSSSFVPSWQKVGSAGRATNTTINSGGEQWVYSGGHVTDTTIISGGEQDIYSGGDAKDTTINSGGLQWVYSGGDAKDTTINSGGWQWVYSGGDATDTMINSGGTQDVYCGGRATNTTINSGGWQWVYSGGHATDTTITRGGLQKVSENGTATSTTITSGGTQTVFAGGSATNTMIYTGGTQFVDDGTGVGLVASLLGGTVSDTTLLGGTQLVSSGGQVSGTVIGGTYTSSGSTIMAGGYQKIGSNGQATSTTINSGGTQTISAGGTATNTKIKSSGLQNVSSGGLAVDTTISAGGTQHIYSGGRANGITIYSGSIQTVDSGGSATGIQNAGAQTVDPGGSDTSSIIYAGATQTVYNGATAMGTLISGTQLVSGQAYSATVASGGTQTTENGGTAVHTVVASGGGQSVAQGGLAIATELNGGALTVASGGIASGATANSGAVIQLSDGAALSGTTTLTQAELKLTGRAGSYTMADLIANGNSMIQLAQGQTVGNHLTIGKLSGNGAFTINTDLAKGQSDRITIQSATGASANTVQVAYDPGFASGKTVTGRAVFADVPSSQTKFTAVATDVGAYRYTPTLSVSSDGTSWSINSLVSNQDNVTPNPTPQPTPIPAQVKPSETMYTASDMGVGSLVLWRAATNSLEKRLGELRGNQGEQGMWTRVYRGAQDLKDSQDRSVTQTYTAMQGGYDTKHIVQDGAWYSGYALGYLSADISLARGTGKASTSTFSLYGSWLGNNGHYLDIIAKGGKTRNNYDSYLQNSVNTKVSGNSAAWTSSLSVEYGYRKQLPNQWYLEPQTEWTFGRVGRASYMTSDQTNVQNDALNSVVGRLGLTIGRQTPTNSFYGKVSVLREFTANSQITMANGALRPVTLEQNLKETWLEFVVGFTAKWNRETSTYIELEKTTGNKMKTPWLINIGIRRSF